MPAYLQACLELTMDKVYKVCACNMGRKKYIQLFSDTPVYDIAST